MTNGSGKILTVAGPMVAAFLVTLLAGCGGGGGGGTPLSGTGTTGGGTATTPTTPTTTTPTTTTPVTVAPVAANLLVVPAKTSLNNSGSDSTALVVTAVDASGNALSGVTANVTVNNNSVYTRDATTVTGASGTVSGVVTIGTDKSNRLITYTATSGSVTKSGTIAVTGTTISGSAVPASPAPGTSVALTVTVLDSAGNGIPGVAVALSGVTGITFPSQQTGITGRTIFTFAAPATAGSYPLSIDANNAPTQTVNLLVSPAGGSTTVPAGSGPIASQSVIANPVVVGSNVLGSTVNQSEVRALFLTSNNVALPNMRVRFKIMSSPLSGESLVANGTTVYSDVSGVAKTSYIAPTVGSPTNGVLIRACYGLTDSFDFSACFALPSPVAPSLPTGQFVETTLTVASSPVSLTIGSDNVIEKTASGISYVKKFEIQAVDASGSYAPNVQLSAVVDTQGYWKGSTMVPIQSSKTVTDFSVGIGTPPVGYAFKFCLNEDVNRNNALDISPTSEDTNHDGILTPRKSDVAIGFVNNVSRTDINGLALLQLTYPQSVASWERVKITVTAGVSGSEGAATYVYQLTPAQADVDAGNGAFLVAPYGTAYDCTVPN